MAEKKDIFGVFENIDSSAFQWVAAVIVTILGILIFTKFSKKISNPIIWFIALYLIGAMILTVTDLVQGNIEFSIIAIPKTFFGYSTFLFLQGLYIILTIPLVLFYLVSGPFMIMVAAVSFFVLLAYFIQTILKIDVSFIHDLELTKIQASLTLGAFIISSTVLYFYEKTEYLFNLGIVKSAEFMEYMHKVLL